MGEGHTGRVIVLHDGTRMDELEGIFREVRLLSELTAQFGQFGIW
jgi:hypothetical protein